MNLGGEDMKQGWNTNAFLISPKDVVALAKEVCKARFKRKLETENHRFIVIVILMMKY